MAELDEVERVLVESDMNNDAVPELRRLRRYESTLHRRMRWAVSQSHFESPHERINPHYKPRYHDDPEETTPAPEPITEAETLAKYHDPNSHQPPFDLTPDEFPEPGERPDIPAILTSRKLRRVAEAQARRDADRREVEKLRA